MYKGTLYFDDGDVLEVSSFILRETEISFDVNASWDDHGRWTRSGIATKRDIRVCFRNPAIDTRTNWRCGLALYINFSRHEDNRAKH